jgi:hypothetical protein
LGSLQDGFAAGGDDLTHDCLRAGIVDVGDDLAPASSLMV